jgi:hypothetical protein
MIAILFIIYHPALISSFRVRITIQYFITIFLKKQGVNRKGPEIYPQISIKLWMDFWAKKHLIFSPLKGEKLRKKGRKKNGRGGS